MKQHNQAFPSPAFPGVSTNFGMTLRAYLAGQALAGYMARANVTPDGLIYNASLCVRAADAIIEELEK